MANARRFAMVQMDVFAARPLEGNPLAVFTDARGLTDAEMQSLAKEMNLSETTFILPRDPATERERGVRVRIFTVNEELPFAGHPTLGTATVLRLAQGPQDGRDEVRLDLNVGIIPVQFTADAAGLLFGEMRQRDPDFGRKHSAEDVARASGLALEDIATDVPIQTVSTGLPFTIVPVRSLRALQNINFAWSHAAEYLERSEGRFFYFLSRETVASDAKVHARMIFYNGEDPATGSAAGCAASWMTMYGVAREEESCIIEQGLEMKRPSRIHVRASRQDGRVTNVRVGGNAVEVLRGEVTL